MIQTLNAAGISAKIDTVGAYLSELNIDGQRVLKPSSDGVSVHGGSAVLIPYSGRVRRGIYSFEGHRYSLPVNDGSGNSIHGFVRDTHFHTVSRKRDRIVLRTEISGKGYPSTLSLNVKYRLSPHKILTSFTISNTGPVNAPLLVGSHPYFSVSEEWKLRFSRPLIRLKAEDIFFPTGETEKAGRLYTNKHEAFDESLFFKGGGRITLESEAAQVEILRHNLNFITLYTGDYTEGRSLAIEPQSGVPDAFNNGIGLKIIKPGQTMNFWFTIGSVSTGK